MTFTLSNAGARQGSLGGKECPRHWRGGGDQGQICFSKGVSMSDGSSAGTGTADLNSTRLMLVEDCPDDQRLMALLLSRAGAEVILECNGESAIRQFERSLRRDTTYDGIVMDLQMSGIDGIETTRRLRSRRYVGPIIAVTAHGDVNTEREWLDAGCSCYVRKPFSPLHFVQSVADAVCQNAAS